MIQLWRELERHDNSDNRQCQRGKQEKIFFHFCFSPHG
jgi:hypothetical protein